MAAAARRPLEGSHGSCWMFYVHTLLESSGPSGVYIHLKTFHGKLQIRMMLSWAVETGTEPSQGPSTL